MTTQTTGAAELPEALPRYREYMHLRTTGAWTSGVPAWARDYSGCMNDMTAAHAVIEELHAKVEALSAAQASAAERAVPAGILPDEVLQALKPFAEIGAWLFARNLPDDTPMVEIKAINGVQWTITRGQFKAAALIVRQHDQAVVVSNELAASPAPAQPGQEGDALSQAARDVLSERQRQISAEGWTPEHDDKHVTEYGEPELSIAAACYAMSGVLKDSDIKEIWWPWALEWWKPSTPRRNLVKAGALILAELERIDRAALAAQREVKP